MSLNHDTTACSPAVPQSPDDEQALESILETFIGIVRLRELTNDNLDEWLFRMDFWDRVHASRHPRKNLRKRLQRWVGLKTNGYNDTREDWIARQNAIQKTKEEERETRRQTLLFSDDD
jgi:hypothetical protein